jgi:hypothetical protein
MNPDNYCTLEAAQRLDAAGIRLETDCFYDRDSHVLLDKEHFDMSVGALPAPCFAEVWRELPSYYKEFKQELVFEKHETVSRGGIAYAYYNCAASPVMRNLNPTDAAIDLLIWVREKEGKG